MPIQISFRPPAVIEVISVSTRRRYSSIQAGSGGLTDVPLTSMPWSSLAPTMKMLICGSRARTTASMCFGQSQNSLRTRPVPTWYSACGVITPVSVASTKTAHDGPAASESPPTQRRSGAAAVGVSMGVVPLPAFDAAVVVVGVASVDVDGDDDVSPVGVLAAASSGGCSRLPLLVIDCVVALESMTRRARPAPRGAGPR